MRFDLLISITIGMLASQSIAKEVSVAVAANFMAPMARISTLFTEKTGHKLVVSSGSSGKFYAQIKHNAPFEVFLSADQEHPQKLAKENLADPTTQFTYAIGKLVLWSPKTDFVDAGGEVLKNNHFRHLAIANPKLAPYGVAAQQVLEKKSYLKNLHSKLIFGENITQVFQFAATGNAELAFVALSQISTLSQEKAGSRWIVPQEYYSPLKQDAILLLKGKENPAAKQFLEFIKSQEALKIISEFGYDY